MRTGWIDHDGMYIPSSAPGVEVRCREEGLHDVLHWGWARTKELCPADVLAYRLGAPWGSAAPQPKDKGKFQVLSIRASILDAARDAVTRDRAETHGEVESSFAHLAAVWSVRLGVTVTPAQVALLMVDLKVTRAWGNPSHADNWVDIAGFAACGGEVAALPDGGGT